MAYVEVDRHRLLVALKTHAPPLDRGV